MVQELFAKNKNVFQNLLSSKSSGQNLDFVSFYSIAV